MYPEEAPWLYMYLKLGSGSKEYLRNRRYEWDQEQLKDHLFSEYSDLFDRVLKETIEQS